MEVPAPGDTSVLNDVSFAAKDNGWAVGSYDSGAYEYTLVEHWNGETWLSQATPSPSKHAHLDGVSGIASGQVWAVGGRIHKQVTHRALSERLC
jgi:hypothetical protein